MPCLFVSWTTIADEIREEHRLAYWESKGPAPKVSLGAN